MQRTIKSFGDSLTNIVSPISSDFGKQIQGFFTDFLSQMGGIINKFAPKGVEMMGSAAADLTNGFIGTVVMIISAYFFIADRERLTEGFWRIAVSYTHLDVYKRQCILSARESSKDKENNISGCGSAWLERLIWDQEAAGSNPVTPIFAGVVQW